MTRVSGLTAGVVLLVAAPAVHAQGRATSHAKVEVGGQVTSLRLNELGDTDVGLGARASFDVTDWVAVEGQLTLFPSDLGGRVPFSRRRVEGLFGVVVGRGIGASSGARTEGVRVFGLAQPGFVRFGPSPEPLFCILIFPQPISCALAEGRTEFAVALGGGAAVPFGSRVSGRVDVSDLLIRFNNPAVRDGRVVSSFTSHNLRVAAGVGFRF